ncbi:ArsR/SmtB family transcription factor [Ralstonia wenshanensis]|uniref:ArsR/SmtB family transcription factor n=1 Tax=Ralstonia wenshanensis TaxID=2842456 RepID=UPI0021B36FAF|nr:metalloregulator ArsR/SmtB family transcription factor [Ralstonia wenshanensis]MCT7308850.1 metalloregulator ArsR/SmtB family transcription factor [Ralstonia wenshanensis]
MSSNNLNLVFAALADPTRRAIVARLAAGEATVNELAEPFDLAQPSISKHLKVLETAGLISRGRDGQTRPCRLDITTLKAMTSWVDHYIDVWEASFDRLDTLLQSDDRTPTKGKRHDRKR